MSSIVSIDSRDANTILFESSRLNTPVLEESIRTATTSPSILFQNVQLLNLRPESNMSDMESCHGELTIKDSQYSMTQGATSESSGQDSMSQSSMFAESITTITTQSKMEATKERICRSPDEIDGTYSRKNVRARTPTNLEYKSCLDDFLTKVSILDLGIPTNLTNDHFLATKHFCNGSHSRIFKAEMKQDMTSKKVVLKVLSESSVHSDVAQKDFQVEIGILTRLNHPHLVNIVGYGELKSKMGDEYVRPLIALECLQGDTLSYHLGLKRSFHVQPFTKLRYFRIAKEFASVLDYIHTRVHPDFILMHRDLKPDNIGFAQDGSLKVFDFGLCTCVSRQQSHKVPGNGNANTSSSSSTAGMSADTYMLTGCTGSFRYMAPENALEKPYNESVSSSILCMQLWYIVSVL